MNKHIFCIFLLSSLFISCKEKAKIVFWDYNENLCTINDNQTLDIKQYEDKYDVIISVPLDDFEYFDSVKKVFKFKDEEKSQKLFDTLSMHYKNELIPYYCFSVVSSGKIIMHGLSRPFPHDVEKYENDDTTMKKLIFDDEKELRLVHDQSLQRINYGIEILHTEEIEKLLPDCPRDKSDNVKVVVDNNNYYIIFEDTKTIVSFNMDGKLVNDCNIKATDFNANIYKVNNGDYGVKLDFQNYQEYTYISKQRTDDDIAFFKDIKWNDIHSYRMKMYQNGTFEFKD